MSAATSSLARRIEKTPNVCGGEARIRRTRIPIWGLVEARRLGIPDEELCQRYAPPVTQDDLNAAWAYYDCQPDEIDRAIWENEACLADDWQDDPSFQ